MPAMVRTEALNTDLREIGYGTKGDRAPVNQLTLVHWVLAQKVPPGPGYAHSQGY